MSTEIEDQIHSYFEWVELRTGHDLRPPAAHTPDRTAPVGAVLRAESGRCTDIQLVAAQSEPPTPRHRHAVLFVAAATIALVVGLAIVGADDAQNPTTPATQPTQPELTESTPLPGWEGNLAIKVFMDPNVTGTQLEAVDQVLADASDIIAEWTYLDVDKSLQEAERVLVNDPVTFGLLDEGNVPTIFNLVATPTASGSSLRQLSNRLQELAGVLSTVTSDQAEQWVPVDTESFDSPAVPVVTTKPTRTKP